MVRVISQNGHIDVPYNEAVFTVDAVGVIRAATNYNMQTMAKYHNEETARKVLDTLRQQYQELCTGQVIFNGGHEYVENVFGRKAIMETLKDYYVKCIFKFPAAEELCEEERNGE